MAAAMKCDRCGNYYDDKLAGIAIRDTGDCIVKRFDLCDECLADLMAFMRMEGFHDSK